MASIIRHGPAGSYKSSYAIWFELLPALRQGRTVVTNVEGMRSLEEIESSLGERFPLSARIFRVSSQTTKGKKLWQHWFNWCPLGAFILIDEVQDIFNKTQGFNADKNLYLGVEHFSGDLPEDYVDYYHRVRAKFKPDDVYVDDIGERIVDENGNVVMPADFKESFQRHRKYNWDLVLCTPNIKSLGDEVKSVSEAAIAHKSRDGILPWSKRKTRLFNHDPRSTTVKPSKDDAVAVEKIPVEVHLLYQSTATGLATKSGVSRPLWKEPKLIMAAVALAVGLSTFLNGLNEVVGNDPKSDINQVQNSQEIETANQAASLSHQEVLVDTNQGISFNQKGSSGTVQVSPNNVLHQMDVPFRSGHSLNFDFPIPVSELYVSSLVTKHGKIFDEHLVTFEVVGVDGQEQYFNSLTLEKLGFDIAVIDHCMVVITYNGVKDYALCRSKVVHDNYSNESMEVAQVEQVDISEELTIF